jgi:hypothetical protein
MIECNERNVGATILKGGTQPEISGFVFLIFVELPPCHRLFVWGKGMGPNLIQPTS